MAGLELGLKDRHGEPVAEVLDAAKRHIGELSMEIELLRERARAAEQRLPLAMRRSERDDLRGDGALFRHPAGVSGLGALALGALRAAGAGTPTTGWARGRRGGGRRRGNRTRSCWRRFGPISRGPRSTAKAIARSTHGFGSWTGSASPAPRVLRVMRAHGLLSPPPRASGRREDPRREGHHPGAQRDVGDGRRAGIHARRRVGLDLRGGRTLERGVHGVARVQSREPLRGTRSDCARARTSLWLAGRRRRPRAGASDGSR